jgi:hypothetical protein
VSWHEAFARLRDEGLLDDIPGDMEEALGALMAARGELYRAVKRLRKFEASPAVEHLAVATECATTALVLHREAVSAIGWPAASRLLLGDGLLTLAFDLVGRQPELDLERFSALISQLLGEEDPECRIEALIARDAMSTVLRDTTTTRMED